jgi:integrase
MVEMQRLAGMRPGEVTIMRVIDLDMSGAVWLFRPGSDRQHGEHKTSWRGFDRVIALGPKAQQILQPFLKSGETAFLFSPADSVEASIAKHRRNHKNKAQPSRVLQMRKARFKRRLGAHYTVDTYRQAVQRACKRANVPVWFPHQLRHSAATEVRKEAGLDAALDVGKASEIMERIG